MRLCIDTFCRIDKYFSNSPAAWLGHLAVYRPETAKKTIYPFERFIDKLLNDYQISGGDFLSKRPNRRTAYYCMDAEFFQGEDISCERHLARRKFMTLTVTIQKRNSFLPYCADHNGCARPAEWRIDIMKLRIDDMLSQHLAKARTTYYPD
jgi:hypothetical protein